MKIKNLKFNMVAISLAAGFILAPIGAQVSAAEITSPPDLNLSGSVDPTTKVAPKVNYEATYNTYQQALEAKNAKEGEYAELGYTNITSSITSYLSGNTIESTIEEDAKENLTLDMVNDYKELLGESLAELNGLNSGKYTLVFNYEKTGVETINKEFSAAEFGSEEEAINAIEKFKEENNIDESFTFNYEIVPSYTVSTIDQGTVNLGTNPTDEDIELAKSEINDKYLGSDIEFTINTIKVGEEIVITKEFDTKTFKSIDEAEEYIEDLKNHNSNITYDLTIKAIPYEVYDETIAIDSSKMFDTKIEAEAFIDELINTYGKTNVTADILTITTSENENGKGTVSYVTKIDRNQGQYIIPQENNFVLIKQAADYVAVWTLCQLTPEQKCEFEESYANYVDTHNVDGSTKGKLNIEFIYGEELHDLSYLGNQWGQYGFSIDENGNIVVTNPSGKISHVNYGIAELPYEKTIYYVNGEYQTYKMEEEYSVVGKYFITEQCEEENKVLEYVVKKQYASYLTSANASKEIDIYQAMYRINKEVPIYYDYYILKVAGELEIIEFISEEQPLIEEVEELIDYDDSETLEFIPEEVPLVSFPVEEVETIEIEAEEVPLTSLPQTGSNTVGETLVLGGGLASLSLGLFLKKRKANRIF